VEAQDKYRDYWKARELKERLALKRLEVRDHLVRGSLRLRQDPQTSRLKADPSTSNIWDPIRKPSCFWLENLQLNSWSGRKDGNQVSQPELVAAGLSSRVDPRHLQLFAEAGNSRFE